MLMNYIKSVKIRFKNKHCYSLQDSQAFESGILTKHDFKGGKARYETIVESHHDHLIDIKSGEIIEFVDEEIEKLQKKVMKNMGINQWTINQSYMELKK